MGEVVEIDPAQLRSAANRVMAAAEQVARMNWPTLDPDDLPGSAVGEVAAPVLVTAQLADVVATMRGWAAAALSSADAFEQADRRTGERFGPR